MDDLELSISGRDAVADWIETALLVRGTRQLGLDAILDMAQAEAKVGAPQASLGFKTMRRRKELLGEAYPFTIIGDLAARARADAAEMPYAALLLLTPASVARQAAMSGSTSEMEVLFERLAERALKHLWGPESRALRFGFPSESGRPQAFSEAIEWLAKQMGIPAGSGYRPPRRKDGGVDVVAWRPFPDGKSGFPVVLAQCTLQSELFSKSADVDVRIWSTWLALDFEPQTALAVPGFIAKPTDWGQIALRSMILDRIRLAHLLVGEVDDQARAWTERVIKDLSSIMLAGET
ncbi:hypothetical protein ACVW00_001011 [Marmoricola sp. URHA0025 HA25]